FAGPQWAGHLAGLRRGWIRIGNSGTSGDGPRGQAAGLIPGNWTEHRFLAHGIGLLARAATGRIPCREHRVAAGSAGFSHCGPDGADLLAGAAWKSPRSDGIVG